jgi:uncharacterized integral membrane protein
LIFLLLIAFALGVGAGLLAGLPRHVRLKRQVSRLRKEQKAGSAPSAPYDGA